MRAALRIDAHFVAHNTFRVRQPHAAQFEMMWQHRRSHLSGFPGFVSFSLLRDQGSNRYISQTVWKSQEAFTEWLNSHEFEERHDPKRLERISYMLESPPEVSTYTEIDAR